MKKEHRTRILAFVVGILLIVFFIYIFILNRNPNAHYPYQDLQSRSLKRVTVVYEGEEVGALSETETEELVLVLNQVCHYGRVYQSHMMVGCGDNGNKFVLEYQDGSTESIAGSQASDHVYINDHAYQSTVEISNQLYELVSRYAKVLIEKDLVTLSDKRKAEILSVWRNTFPTDTEFVWFDEADEQTWENGIRYYGAYERIIVLYVPKFAERPTESIGGVEMDGGILLYWDGEFHEPRWSYDNGFVTEETLQCILDVHGTFFD